MFHTYLPIRLFWHMYYINVFDFVVDYIGFQTRNHAPNAGIWMRFTADSLRNTNNYRNNGNVASLFFDLIDLPPSIYTHMTCFPDFYFQFTLQLLAVAAPVVNSVLCRLSIMPVSGLFWRERQIQESLPSFSSFSSLDAFGVKQYRLFGNVLFCSVSQA